MSLPKVSVVLATHRAENLKFLQQAIESVLLQTYNDIELLVVADGELTPDSTIYLRTLSDDRVRLIFLDSNQGPAIARNVAIRSSRGEYIVIMDADDICRQDRIEQQLRYLRATDADLVGSSYFEIDDYGKVIGEKKMPISRNAIVKSCPFFNPVNNPTVLARAKILKQHNYPENFRLGEDYRLWIHLLREGFSIVNHPESLLFFRRGSDFLYKRRGFAWASSDLRNKLYARRLVPWQIRPIVIVFAFVTFILRMLPPALSIWVYKVRRMMTTHI